MFVEGSFAVNLGFVLAFVYVFIWLPFIHFQIGKAGGWLFKSLFFFKNTEVEEFEVVKPKRTRTVSVDEALDSLDGGMKELKEKIKAGKIRAYYQDGQIFINASDLKKPSKRSRKDTREYPVIETYDEQHKITNPVEFTT